MSMGAGTSEASVEILKIGGSLPITSERIAISLESPVAGEIRGFVEANRITDPENMVQPNTALGQTLALCGAGPSLRSLSFDKTDQLWACNSALPYLVEQGVDVTAGIGIDQTPGLLKEWSKPPDVTYYVASSCDPEMIAHLRAHNRKHQFFHNCVGFIDEWEWDEYCEHWPPGYMVGEGATVVSRAIGLAQWMGFERVDVYGADCAFGEDDLVHANGEGVSEAYGNPVLMQGEISGRMWRTRPDMLLGAVDLVRKTKKSEGRIRLMGDTLAVALLGKSEEFLTNVMRRLSPTEIETGELDNG